MDGLTLRLFSELPKKSQKEFMWMIKLMSWGYTGGGTWDAHAGTICFKRQQKMEEFIQKKMEQGLVGGE